MSRVMQVLVAEAGLNTQQPDLLSTTQSFPPGPLVRLKRHPSFVAEAQKA